jgi:hypothetical protein
MVETGDGALGRRAGKKVGHVFAEEYCVSFGRERVLRLE